MKALIAIALINACILTSCSLPVARGRNGATFASALQYNNYIVERQSGVITHILSISKTADTNLDAAEGLLNKGVVLTDSVLADVAGLSDFQGDSVLRNAAVSLFVFYRRAFDSDYRQMIALRKKGESLSREDYLRLQMLQQKLEDEESEKDKRFHNAQVDFAEKNRLRLADNALQKQIDAGRQ